MRYLVLAADYDGTLARDGRVDEPTLAALRRLKESGRHLVLVTGRELDELVATCPEITMFDRVVAENGAVLYRPRTREEKILTERPPDAFVEALRHRGVGPISFGRVIVATWEPHQTAVLETIRQIGLELHVIFNKRAVMILPSGVNKATGLTVALDELGLSPHNAVAVGDAENDHAFMALCECSAAVANALPQVKERADFVAACDHGAGVVELIEKMLADDLAQLPHVRDRHAILLGRHEDGTEEWVDPQQINILVAGTSGSGKSTMTTGLLERLAEPGYQYAIVDPEGDYATLEGAIVLGDPHRGPTVKEVLDLLAPPRQNVVVNLLGIALEHRPAFFMVLLPHLQELRSRTGRPHWIVVDEAHHLLPVEQEHSNLTIPQRIEGMFFITVHPASVAKPVLEAIDLVLAVGETHADTIRDFCRSVGGPVPDVDPSPLESGDTIAWWRLRDEPPQRVRTIRPRSEHNRHSRKYAEGHLGSDRAFVFRGPYEALNLQADNLVLFLKMADGVDDATWMHHLRRGDYSAWFREGIKDDELAAEAGVIEDEADRTTPSESRADVRAAIEKRYTLPSEAASGT
jgi:HAD superfamily hydrolase (TIGR01484 family)